MASKVFFGSAKQARWDAKETLPGKLDLIIDQLHLRDRVKDETVAIKMHTGNNVGYSTVHPIFIRKVVEGGSLLSRISPGTYTRRNGAAIHMSLSAVRSILLQDRTISMFMPTSIHIRALIRGY
jgi:hypothetical protein